MIICKLCLLWMIASLLWCGTFGQFGELDDSVRLNEDPLYLNVWRLLGLGWSSSKELKFNLLGRVVLAILVALLYFPCVLFGSIMFLIGYIICKIFRI